MFNTYFLSLIFRQSFHSILVHLTFVACAFLFAGRAWVSLSCNCPLIGQSGGNSSQDVLDGPHRMLESVEMQVRQSKATMSHETLQCVTMGGFTATTVPLLSPRIPRQFLFNICALMCVIAACVDHLDLELRRRNVWMTLTWNCVTGMSG